MDEAPTLEELKAAIYGLNRAKASGSDGFLTEFYQAYLTILGEKILRVFMEENAIGVLPLTMRKGVINLLAKPGGDPEDPSSYRPITIINIDVKILCKVLAMRL
ncbi:hypothetical protein NDU88_002507 [Pleurodeles waltl]|uniref:Reverse transcriptase n=1 Tax=Pleurodeles waltl TaxID=8319 RepID=A0AAV7MPV0_PLEWA|nr:hypothetical protein NDU88_002507 [Pleurodeles waltl]